MLQRPELRPILSALGWSDSQRRRGSDDAVVTSIRDFLATHLHSDGTRFSEQQAAFNVIVQAAAGPLVKSERHIAAAAEALGVRPYPFTPPHPGQDDETADGETTWFATARGPEEKNESTITCGPTTLVKNHYSVPVEWVNLHELNDEFAIFKAWPSEQNRVAATHLLAVPELKWAKEEGGLFYLARSEYDLACGQV